MRTHNGYEFRTAKAGPLYHTAFARAVGDRRWTQIGKVWREGSRWGCEDGSQLWATKTNATVALVDRFAKEEAQVAEALARRTPSTVECDDRTQRLQQQPVAFPEALDIGRLVDHRSLSYKRGTVVRAELTRKHGWVLLVNFGDVRVRYPAEQFRNSV